MSFDKLFRPYQSPDTTPPRQSIAQPPGDSGPIVLVMGQTATPKVMNGSFSASVTTYKAKLEAENTNG